MKATKEQLRLAANTVRCLCADIVDKANSGHPGAPLGMADLAVSLWLNHLNVVPADTAWPARDRLVFSGGHASSLVYALSHLAGVGGLSIDELKTFRQLGSRCAGHPERGVMPGVEVTTGPLGQGVAMGMGLALGAKKARTGNKTWIFCGDGDMQEGISHEACSWAGAMRLDDTILVYDSNGITIEGHTDLAMIDDTAKRFESYGWKVLACDGHDYDAIDAAYQAALATKGQPVLIVATTHIGCGAPTKQDTPHCHGSPLGTDETKKMKAAFGFDPEKTFDVPAEVYQLFADRAKEVAAKAEAWRAANPGVTGEVKKYDQAVLDAALPTFEVGASLATRNVNETVLNALAPVVPELVGGSADLAPSNKTYLKGLGDVTNGSFDGRNLHYGIRELAMTAIANGLTAFGDFRAYGATFFVFSDYCKPAIRLAALMKLPSLFVFSHDSFYVGEDGPTHEPIEQLASLRSMPNVTTFRPADANETAYAWSEMILNVTGPSCILTTRQNLPVLEGTSREGVKKGGYVIFEKGEQNADAVLFIASGSEVSLAIDAAKKLAEEGRAVRVVSVPSMERFFAQEEAYIEKVTPFAMKKRVVVEAAGRFGLERYIADPRTTRYVTMSGFGDSAPYKVLAQKFGFTTENVLAVAKTLA